VKNTVFAIDLAKSVFQVAALAGSASLTPAFTILDPSTELLREQRRRWRPV
jgi:hypothetical protein